MDEMFFIPDIPIVNPCWFNYTVTNMQPSNGFGACVNVYFWYPISFVKVLLQNFRVNRYYYYYSRIIHTNVLNIQLVFFLKK